MGMGRLLTPKLNPHLSCRGSLPLTRRSSSSSSSLENGRNLERLPDSKASFNKDIGQKGMNWYSLGGLLTNLKQKLMGNMPSFLNQPPAEKMVSLHKDKNSIPRSAKDDESLVSQSVAEIEMVMKRETTPVEKDSNSLELAQEKKKVLQTERVGVNSKHVLPGLVTEEEASDKKVSLSNMFINLHPDNEVRSTLTSEALSNTNSTRESSCGGPHGLFQNITKQTDQQSGEVTAIRERKTTYPFGSSKETLAVSKDSSIRNLIVTLRKNDLFSATEEKESKGLVCSQATLPAAATSVNQESTEKSLDALSNREHSPNKVVLRFLHQGFQKSDIVESFSEFGAVLDVQEVPSFEGCIYKDALVTFETKSAVKKALKKGAVMVKHCSVIVEATSQKDMVDKIRIPDLIGDPDVPVSLVKEPTRTVKIHPLDPSIGSDQIREALRFCKSDISKIIFGSSTKAAFIEFETEDGKERALAAHSVDVLNKQLFLSRIDIPRTTVARISNLAGLMTSDLRKLCVPYGQIKQMFHRGKDVADVHFDVSEWPNMLTILNSMNGKERNGKKWVVRPATVIPHEILKVLWEDPQGMRYVKGLIKNMVREIEQPLDAAALSSLCSALED
ncbi:RNA-binding (RRM/RBD/RNP motifs) family protein [Raphanus sativus]|uniref:Uncharacterized protein LOC108858199 isoform X1 n=1 Tax=Raphanus sativus TaxID=3726 RepID=A0A9W3BQR8_RAPSA|nr:uncharacterized protein LOC108858199 isoform X1 [Raphanus sativus]KAJ4894381.1 RNA-binding (RRM/RBD/RNP motifs) family protein [Raphanus sativus]